MRHSAVDRVSRIFVIIMLVAFAGIGWIAARTAGFGLPDASGLLPQGVVGAAWDKKVALVSGHAGNDSGAVCEDDAGTVTLAEADVNARVTELAGERLRQAGADVEILEEFDPRLRGLQVDVFLSVHADSCIDATGYKAAIHAAAAGSAGGDTSTRFLSCLDEMYPAATGLPHHPTTVTHNMTEYHAFRKIDPATPAAIIELGFLGGDRELLADRPEQAAKGVADSILCFLKTEGEGSP
jgi:N-acetylmuramoyl-L-alanine amidase